MWKHEFTGNEITDNQYQVLTSYDKRNYYRVAQPVDSPVNQQEDEDEPFSFLNALANDNVSSSEDNISNDTSSNDSSDFGGFGGGDSGGAGASSDY